MRALAPLFNCVRLILCDLVILEPLLRSHRTQGRSTKVTSRSCAYVTAPYRLPLSLDRSDCIYLRAPCPATPQGRGPSWSWWRHLRWPLLQPPRCVLLAPGHLAHLGQLLMIRANLIPPWPRCLRPQAAAAPECALPLPTGGERAVPFAHCVLVPGVGDGFTLHWDAPPAYSTAPVSWGLSTAATGGYVALAYPSEPGEMVGAAAFTLQACSSCPSGAPGLWGGDCMGGDAHGSSWRRLFAWDERKLRSARQVGPPPHASPTLPRLAHRPTQQGPRRRHTVARFQTVRTTPDPAAGAHLKEYYLGGMASGDMRAPARQLAGDAQAAATPEGLHGAAARGERPRCAAADFCFRGGVPQWHDEVTLLLEGLGGRPGGTLHGAVPSWPEAPPPAPTPAPACTGSTRPTGTACWTCSTDLCRTQRRTAAPSAR